MVKLMYLLNTAWSFCSAALWKEERYIFLMIEVFNDLLLLLTRLFYFVQFHLFFHLLIVMLNQKFVEELTKGKNLGIQKGVKRSHYSTVTSDFEQLRLLGLTLKQHYSLREGDVQFYFHSGLHFTFQTCKQLANNNSTIMVRLNKQKIYK